MPRLTRRTLLALGALASLALPAGAEDFPTKPVTLVIPFAAGGSTDVVGRIIAERMSKELGQQVVVENRAGAGGSLGAGTVARAAPDGYTILMGTVATHALDPLILAQAPYDAVADFAPISLLVLVPNVLAVNPELPVNTVQELIDMAKADPGVLAYASSGNGTPLHLSGELFKSMAGVDIQHVPYQGSGPALTDVLGNQVPIIFDNLPSASAHISSGALRALGVTTATRAPSFPDVPTIAETLPGYETYSWNALFAPAGTPAEVVERLNAAALAALADPAVAGRMDEFSAEIVGSTPEELAAHVQARDREVDAGGRGGGHQGRVGRNEERLPPRARRQRVARSRAARRRQPKNCAPFAEIVEPVMKPASSEARKTTMRAISSGSPRRPTGICGDDRLVQHLLGRSPSPSRWRCSRAQTTLTVMPARAPSCASALGEADVAGLGGRVVGLAELALLAVDRGDGDDRGRTCGRACRARPGGSC